MISKVIYTLCQVDGHMVARTKFDSDGFQSTMLVEGDVLLVYGNGGKLRAYRLEDKGKGFFSR